jgi:transcription termination factor NusB
LTHNNHHYHYQQAVSKLQSSSKGSNNENSNRKKIPTTSRVVAAQALIEKRTTKKKKSNNNNSAVTKLEASSEFVLMSQRDKNFARNLVSTTTRRTGQIDIILGIVCSKYPPKCGKYTGIVVSALRMGVAQILFMDVKGFAAVKETVNVLKHDKHQTP